MKFEVKNIGQRKMLHREGELLPGSISILTSETYHLLKMVCPGELKLLNTVDETPKKKRGRRSFYGSNNDI